MDGFREGGACGIYFEIDIKMTQDNPLTLSVWNHHPETDAGCNEPKDKEWTTRSVRNQVWKIQDGKSATRGAQVL